MLSISYNNLVYATVPNPVELFKEKLDEAPKLRALFNNTKLLFNLPGNRILVEVAQGQRVYKFILLTPDVHKRCFGWFVYMPQRNRLDFYDAVMPEIPYIQWSRKSPATKNYSMLLDFLHVDRLFDKLINVI